MVSTKTAEKAILKRNRIKDPWQDKLLYAIVGIFFAVFVILVLYPIIFVISASFSSGAALNAGQVILWPVDPGLHGYEAVFSHKYVLSGYRNTIFYTIVGTAIGVSVTFTAAYPLTRRDFPARRFMMVLCTITMFFGGGLVPFYILMVNLKFINTIWAMLIPGALSVYNMILVRTNIMSNIPNELLEAAQIDGCSDTRYFFEIVLPLSKAVIAVITLYTAVGHWNSYFNAMIFLRDKNLFPLQLILREILVSSRIDLSEIEDADLLAALVGLENLLKYSLIVVSSVPIICVYPFIQKYFIKGVMIGSLKG
jgi:putative aldouronate transport system permease protein